MKQGSSVTLYPINTDHINVSPCGIVAEPDSRVALKKCSYKLGRYPETNLTDSCCFPELTQLKIVYTAGSHVVRFCCWVCETQIRSLKYTGTLLRQTNMKILA